MVGLSTSTMIMPTPLSKWTLILAVHQKQTLRLCLDIVYFTEIENLLLKVL